MPNSLGYWTFYGNWMYQPGVDIVFVRLELYILAATWIPTWNGAAKAPNSQGPLAKWEYTEHSWSIPKELKVVCCKNILSMQTPCQTRTFFTMPVCCIESIAVLDPRPTNFYATQLCLARLSGSLVFHPHTETLVLCRSSYLFVSLISAHMLTNRSCLLW